MNEWMRSILKTEDGITHDKEVIANTFNKLFVTKIENLKENIDDSLKEDPIVRLKESMKNNKSSFRIKQTNEKQLKVVFKNNFKIEMSSNKNAITLSPSPSQGRVFPLSNFVGLT